MNNLQNDNLQSINNTPPMDQDRLMIWEKQLKEREKELEKKEIQMGIFLHDLNHSIHRLYNIIYPTSCIDDNDSDLKKKDAYGEIECLLEKISNTISAYQLFVSPAMLKHDIVGYRDVRTIITHIFSLYSRSAKMRKITVHINEGLTKEHKHKLGIHIGLAVAMVIDSAIYNAPNNTDINISFLEEADCLNVEFKSWEKCVVGGDDDHLMIRRGFGAGIIWNNKDKSIALSLFHQICESYNIYYSFSKGDEKKEIDGEKCQSTVVKLTFN